MLLGAVALAGLWMSSASAAVPVDVPIADSATPTVCAVCTVGISVIERLAVIHNATVDHEVEHVCELFPAGKVRDACDALVLFFGPEVIRRLTNKENADDVCHGIGLCDGKCHLYGTPYLSRSDPPRKVASPLPPGLPAICKIPGVEKLCEILYGFGNNHLPLEDEDGDLFSSNLKQFRGTDWRGKDCGPHDRAFHPGAVPINSDRETDSNCNGIYGVNPATQIPYEEELCSGTPTFGTAVLGDSASAHFHVPPQYIDASMMNNSTFAHIEEVLANEFDWPMLSSTSAFYQSSATFGPDISGPVNSSYEIIRARNRCSHRDYQNLGVNGARTGAMNTTIQQGLARNSSSDHPLVLMYSLIGNDVCNGHQDTVAHMTTPTQFRANVMSSIAFLESRLPIGSHVLMMGLADGRVLYDSLHNRTHPLGVTYSQVYDFLNCLEISPCSGWLNGNESLRVATQQRADELSAVIKDITENVKPRSFDLHYVENPIDQAIQRWKAMGRETWELIEPVDGFHPNQIANYLVTSVVWDRLMSEVPDMVPINPHNAEIEKLFGDQGGY